jgi:ATP-dependent Clp protease adaptor protein ClpS
MSDHDWQAVSLPQKEGRARQDHRREQQPRYRVTLWNDDHHSSEYMVEMLQQIFGQPFRPAVELAAKVSDHGRAVVLTTTMEHAELKQDQIHAYGIDVLVDKCRASMSCTIEPEE